MEYEKYRRFGMLSPSFVLSSAGREACSGAPELESIEILPTDALDTAYGSVLSANGRGQKVLLVVSFGTSYNETRNATIGAIENTLQSAYPDYDVRRAFTSQTVINILKKREGLEIDNVNEAMKRMLVDGVREVVIQPTHVINGYEYEDLVAESEVWKDRFERFQIGMPLLFSEFDFDRTVAAIVAENTCQAKDNTAIVLMGHGTKHKAGAAYQKLQNHLNDAGHKNCFVGTVEGDPGLEDILPLIRASGVSRIVLLPLMVVAGDHVANDMAGDHEDSWKSVLEAAGFEVECILKGLGEYNGIRDIYTQHVADAIAEG